jgi:UDP-glucose 4-epimerase
MFDTCVIGGAGFIGAHVVAALVTAGHRVLVLGRSAHPAVALPKTATYSPCDVTDSRRLRSLLDGVENVVDLAYSTNPSTSFEQPLFDLQSNLPRMLAVVEALSTLNSLNRYVFVSSGGTVYGEPSRLPVTEDSLTNPISPYGITKLTTEKYLNMYRTLQGLPVLIIRPSNAFGPGQKPNPKQGFIGQVISKIQSGEEIVIFGEHGTVRDYIFVTDLADAILSVVAFGMVGETYNAGTGIGRSNTDVVTTISGLMGVAADSISIKRLPSRRFDVTTNVLDAGKLKEDTGWVSKTSFEEGLRRTIGR